VTSSSAINTNGTDILVTRLTANGKLDSTFNQTGVKVIDLCCGEYCFALKLQGDGKILIGGSGIDTPNTGTQFLLIRLLPDGRFDSNFNSTGIVFTEINNQGSRIFGLTINPNGKIIATGYNADGVSIFNVALACYQTDGQLDPAFNNSGIRTYSFAIAHEYPECISVQSNGKIVVCGFNNNGNSMNGFIIRLQGEWPVNSFSLQKQDDFLVYPNPTQSSISIQSNKNQIIQNIRIRSLSGTVLKDSKTQHLVSPIIISLEEFPEGYYLIDINHEIHVVYRGTR
jgi:uncharacterized delta-60 repeat protein